jgi:hypothetical protein
MKVKDKEEPVNVENHIQRVKAKLLQAYEGLITDIMYYMEQLEEGENLTVDTLHAAKKNLLITQIRLPISSNVCIYCHINNEEFKGDCTYCSYGKEHGICTESYSDYHKLLKKHRELYECIKNY